MTLLQLGELLQCKRVDWTHESQLAFKLTSFRLRRYAFGQLGQRRCFGYFRFDLKIATNGLNS